MSYNVNEHMMLITLLEKEKTFNSKRLSKPALEVLNDIINSHKHNKRSLTDELLKKYQKMNMLELSEAIRAVNTHNTITKLKPYKEEFSNALQNLIIKTLSDKVKNTPYFGLESFKG